MNKKLPRRAQILAYLQECYQLKHPEASLPAQVSPMRAPEFELDVQYIDKTNLRDDFTNKYVNQTVNLML